MAEGVKHGKCPFGVQDVCGSACEIYDIQEKTCPIAVIAKELKKITKKPIK